MSNRSDPVGTPRHFRVRPYTLTRGRTRSEVELTLDTMLQRVTTSGYRHHLASEQTRTILELCAGPTPLAEVAGRIGQPLQVVSVLVGDLVKNGALEQVVPERDGDERPDLQLLERVLDGLSFL